MPAIKLVIEEMKEMYVCDEIYLSVIKENEPAIRVYEKVGLSRQVRFFRLFTQNLFTNKNYSGIPDCIVRDFLLDSLNFNQTKIRSIL